MEFDERDALLTETIKYIDDAKRHVPDEFKWSGRPLPEMVEDMAERILALEAAQSSPRPP